MHGGYKKKKALYLHGTYILVGELNNKNNYQKMSITISDHKEHVCLV